MVAMEVAAEKATELPRLGKPRMKLNVHASHTDHKVRLFPDSGYYTVMREEWTNRYGSGSATVGRLCAGTWTLGSRHRG
jgi:hypothetical protein